MIMLAQGKPTLLVIILRFDGFQRTTKIIPSVTITTTIRKCKKKRGRKTKINRKNKPCAVSTCKK